MTPQKTVEDLEIRIVRKRLTKRVICKKAGLTSSNLSNMLRRGREGHPMMPEHLEKIYKAIDTLPEGAR